MVYAQDNSEEQSSNKLLTLKRYTILSDENILEAADGHDRAVMEIVEAGVDVDAFKTITDEELTIHKIRGEILTGQTVSIQLPNKQSPETLKVNTVYFDKNLNITTYVGTIKGNKYSSFTLSVDKQKVIGNITEGKNLFVIKPFENDSKRHTITWLDKSLILPYHDSEEKAESFKSKSLPEIKSHNNYNKVRILYLFGNNVSNPNALAANITATFNTALYNSGVNYKNSLMTAGVQVLPTDFGTDCRSVMNDNMKNRSSYFNDIDTRRANAFADIVVSVAKGNVNINCPLFGSYTGRIGGEAQLYLQSNNPWATFSDNYALGDLTAIHEIGHIFNARHANDSPNLSQKAIVSNDFTQQTVMGGYQFSEPNVGSCDFVYASGIVATQTCVRLNVFSNLRRINDNISYPRQFNDGKLMGKNDRNVASYLQNVAFPTVANYVANPPPPPSSPSLSSQSEHCYGLSSFAWTSVANATEYRLYNSSYAWFSSPNLIYSGTAISTFANVSGTKYFRVQACNSGGCSAYSNQVTASFYNGCI